LARAVEAHRRASVPRGVPWPSASVGAMSDEAAADAALEEVKEEDMTPEARMAWLKARGVQIEDFSQRRAGSALGMTAAAGGPRFSYVFLPADESADAEERSAGIGSGDVLPGLLGPSFAGSVDDDALQRTAASHGQSVGLEAMRLAAARGGAEAFRLAAPTDGNGKEAVHIYLDDCAALKQLPLNRRATALARTCGFPKDCEFHGDVYVGRTRWTKDGIVNADFGVKDLDAGALWQRRAPMENLEFQKQTQPEGHAEAQAMGLATPELASGTAEGYTWQDGEEDVEITVQLEDPRAKKVSVAFKRGSVEMSSPIKLNLKLYAEVDADACTWTYCPEGVRLTLLKEKEVAWPRLLKT